MTPMPYKPKPRLLFQMLFRRQNREAAEGLFFEGTYLSDKGEDADARLAFRHSAMLDSKFGGARYNYAALTEKLLGVHADTIAAWEDYVRCSLDDPRQRRETIARVQKHIDELKAKLSGGAK